MNDNKLDQNYPKNDFYSLTKVIGLGSKSIYGVSSNTKNGLLTYITGATSSTTVTVLLAS